MSEPTAKIIKSESWEQYIASGALGSSALSAWTDTGLAQWSEDHLEGQPYSDDDERPTVGGAKEGGDYLDALVTGNKPLDGFVVRPADIDGRTKAGKEWLEANAGKVLLKDEQSRQVHRAVPLVKEGIAILANGNQVDYQVTLRGYIAGLLVQTRPDVWIESETEIDIPDIKYVGQIARFDRDFDSSRYWIQAALAHTLAVAAGVTKRINVRFLLAESGTMNPRVKIIRVPPADLAMYCERLEARCAEIAAVKASELGFVDVIEVRDLELPSYVRR